MFCNNCGKEVEEGAAFCGACGAKQESDDSESLEFKSGETTEIPVAAGAGQVGQFEPQTVPVEQPRVQSPVAVQQPETSNIAQAQKTTSAGGSKAPVVIIVIATIVIVICGILIALAVTKPNIEFLKDTPFSSAKTEVEKSEDSKSSEKKSGDSTSSTKKDSSSSSSKSDSKSDSSSSNSNSNSGSSSSSSKSNTYIISDSTTRKLSSSELESYSSDDLCKAMNEIWARHGRKFNNNWLQNYFNSQSWYSGTIEADNFLNVYKPTEIEDENSKLISSILDSRGYSVSKAHPN